MAGPGSGGGDFSPLFHDTGRLYLVAYAHFRISESAHVV